VRRALLAFALVLGLTGCGLGEGERRTGVDLRVTQDFGTRVIGERSASDVREADTVMRLLDRSFAVETRYGGGFVQSIEGVAGGQRKGRPVDWFYYVNGVEAPQGSASRRIEDGDAIWWDHHDWGTAMRVPAVVGSFPAPFVSTDAEAKRQPIRVDCAGEERECKEVVDRLAAAGVTAVGQGALNQAAGEGVIRVLVGTFDELRRDRGAATLSDGPAASGVFARFTAAGLELLDPEGQVEDTLGPGSGLVAATRVGEQQPTWLVTGADTAGVAAAAAALTADTLDGHFAIAIDEGVSVPLPITDPPPPNEPETG
jgi:hypothetical protein